MTGTVEIRETDAGDLPALERLYRDAFPEEDLVALVRDLLGGNVSVLSLAAFSKGAIVGHVAFTRCTAGADAVFVALLGPLAVAPDRQRQGIGRALVATGHDRLAAVGVAHVYVLGDPAYYSRLGFVREDNVRPPYELPEEWDGAWQSARFRDTTPAPEGTIDLPLVWLRRELWSP